MRAVLDTNVLVRAIMQPRGSLGRLLWLLRSGAFILIYSQPLLDELEEVLRRPSILRRLAFDQVDTAPPLRLIRQRGEAVVPECRIAACHDPDDDRVLEAAVAGRADVIVTSDQDLLVLHPFEGIPIVRPPEFLAMLASQPGGRS